MVKPPQFSETRKFGRTNSQIRSYRLDGKRFASGSAVARYVAELQGFPPMKATWQVHVLSSTFVVRVGGNIIFDRVFTDNGLTRTFEGKPK